MPFHYRYNYTNSIHKENTFAEYFNFPRTKYFSGNFGPKTYENGKTYPLAAFPLALLYLVNWDSITNKLPPCAA